MVLLCTVGLLTSCSEGASLGETEFVHHTSGGHVFVTADADESVRLLIRAIDADDALAGHVPVAAPIPGEFWEGEVAVGHDLLINFAHEADEVDERTLIDERWSVTAGVITIAGPIPTDCGRLVATASGLIIESSDGAALALPETILLQNAQWGCFFG